MCSSATTRSYASSIKPVLTTGGTGGVGVDREDKLRSPYVWRVPLMAGLLRDLCVLGDVSMSDGLFDVVCSLLFFFVFNVVEHVLLVCPSWGEVLFCRERAL